MSVFNIIQGSTVILKQRGVYRQSELYHYAGGLYAKHGSGFVRLMKHENRTSVPNLSWENAMTYVGEVSLHYDNIGRALWAS